MEKKKKEFSPEMPGFDFEFEKIEGRVNEMISKMIDNPDFPSDQPIVMGFALKMGENGQPLIQEFNNFKENEVEIEETEPLVETQNLEKSVIVTIELPGVKKQEIDLNSKSRSLTVSVWNEHQQFFKHISLPEEILSQKTKARFKNGILEIQLLKKKPVAQKNKIKIE
ncbi:Hsp20 family protein [Candidatus Micrarchaeota archaeon]|nr:Hsp20 family protein [Candidatus Micrarchaeota archaeon]MBU1931017.1 Hsp20 family protein [Candidatus Micrarchaeota archaeon]